MSESPLLIDLPPQVQGQIEEHCASTTVNEVGGFLVGTIDDTTRIVAAIPATAAAASQVSLTFTHEVWEDVLNQVQSDYPGEKIVGWYHSHPGFGLFLSDYDSFIQENFFSSPGQVALVVDPVEGSLGWFRWHEGAVEELSRTATEVAPLAKGEQLSQGRVTTEADAGRRGSRSGKRGLLLLGALATLLAALVLGWWLGTSAEQDNVADLSTEVEQLQLQLSQAQTSETAEPSADPAPPGAATGQPPGQPESVAPSLTYTVQPGDTLSRIAAGAYGDGEAFSVIVEANPGLDPNNLAIGQQIKLPVPVAAQ